MGIKAEQTGQGMAAWGTRESSGNRWGKQLEEAQRKESTKGSGSGIARRRMIMGEVKPQRSFRVIQVANSTS